MKATTPTDPKQKKNVTQGCVILVILAVALFFIVKSCLGDTTPDKEMDLSVSFNGTQFVVTNNDSIAYTDVHMELNGKFNLKTDYFPAKETFTVGMLQFADETGNRFLIGMKPQKFTIKATDPQGDRLYFYSEWK